MFKELERIGKKITNNLNIKAMTREQEILKAYNEQQTKLGNQEHTFMRGAKWADAHPQWISVEDELPPRWETNPNVSVPVITFGTIGESIPFVELQRYDFGGSKWQYSDATHWMPLPQKTSSSEIPNNCEKGGEE